MFEDSVCHLARLCLPGCLRCSHLVSACLLAVLLGNIGTAKCWDKTLGYLSCVGYVSAFCATGSGSRSGGVLVPLGTAVPWGDSPRVQGGPWAPPPCGDKSSETLLVLYLVFVRFLWMDVGYSVWCFLSLFLSLCLVCSSATFFSLSFSLSQALGKPKPRVGFGIPLVTLLPGRGVRLRPVPLHFLLHQGLAPHLCFFCFFSFVARLPARCFSRSLSWFWLVSPGVGLGRSVFFALACMHWVKSNAGRPAAKAPHPLPLWIKPSRVTRLLLGVDPGTV